MKSITLELNIENGQTVEFILCSEKTYRMARKAQRKRAKTNSSKSGKRPRNNIRTSKKTAKLFQRPKQFLDILFKESWRSTELFLEKQRKSSIWTENKDWSKNFGVRECWKSPLVFIQLHFSTENRKKFGIFWKNNLKKTQIAEKTKTK